MIINYGENFIAPDELIPDELFKISDLETINDFINVNSFEPQSELDLLDDTNDNINTKELIENQSKNFYQVKITNTLNFNSKKYNIDMQKYEENERHKYIISMPTKPQLKNLDSFHLVLKLTKSNKTFSDNIMAKILSENFIFNKSFFKISEEDTEIKVTKINKECNSYTVRIKIYYNNVVVEDELIDFYKRAKQNV
ncbi:MAG: hypothetical protein IJ530_03335 [Treponema sp.]|uniref:hypothetical protein n=1 Tax=Treponema sp. TaxID=166 RepID=UPI0025DE3184|nr:hypothetical protein [Treponema sp.]MBQ8678777.1 hypothetical protein [Treponema sp.]